jgi:hypothetical protein
MPAAPVSPESRIAFTTLYESPLIGVHDYRCTLEQGGPAAEEESGEDNIVLMRHGAFCKHFEGRSVTANVNQAAFSRKTRPTASATRRIAATAGPYLS